MLKIRVDTKPAELEIIHKPLARRTLSCFFPSCFCVAACFAASFSVSSPASADLIEASGGVKGFAGGNLWSTPSGGTPGYDGVGFVKNAGGFGWGTGLYLEARVLKFIGLELGLTYDKSSLYRNVKYNGVLDVREKVDMTNLRIPVLFKGIAPVPFGRLSVFLGPEFIMAQSADPSLEITSGSGSVLTSIAASKKNSTMFTCGLGATIDLPASLELPLEFRASKNLSQEEALSDRVAGLSANSPLYTVTAQNSWDFRLGLGLGYKFK